MIPTPFIITNEDEDMREDNKENENFFRKIEIPKKINFFHYWQLSDKKFTCRAVGGHEFSFGKKVKAEYPIKKLTRQ